MFTRRGKMDKEFLARGKRGITYRSNYHGKEVVIKEKNPASTALGTIENEYNFLKVLNEHDIGAKVLAYEDDKLIMEFIHGELIIDFLNKHDKDEILNVLKNILHFSLLYRIYYGAHKLIFKK